MARSIADVFRQAARTHEKRISAFIDHLPTTEDRRRFFEAARLFLSFDREIMSLPPARRRTLLNKPIEEDTNQQSIIVAALWQASKRLLRENLPGDDDDDDDDLRLFGARILMARLTVGGLQGISDRRALMDAALQLRELGTAAELARSTQGGRSARRDALSETSAQRKLQSARLKVEAEKLRKERPNLRSKRDRADKLNKRFKKNGWDAWPTSDALVEYARRNDIKI